MNRRTFLKQLPIVATLPFLPIPPALPEPQKRISKLSVFKPSGVEIIARNLSRYLTEIEARKNTAKLLRDVEEMNIKPVKKRRGGKKGR